MTYPITITRAQVEVVDACEESLAAFDSVAPDGVLTIPDVAAHVALLSSPLAPYEADAIAKGLVPPIVAAAGHHGAATAGYRGTATAGVGGTATAGDLGTATAGHHGAATVGYRGTATAAYEGIATAGYEGAATAGCYGTATAGYRGTATAGVGGTATAGHYGTATAGIGGTATAGNHGTATAGVGGILQWRVWDGHRTRIHTAYVGEGGIKSNTPYRCAWVDGKPVVTEVTQ